MGPIKSATSDAVREDKEEKSHDIRRKTWSALYIYGRLKSAAVVACSLKINESSVRTIVKIAKNIFEAICAAMFTCVKTLHFWWNTFLSCIENTAFMWVQVTPVDSNMIQEKKMKSLYDNLKWKEGGSSKPGEFNARKG